MKRIVFYIIVLLALVFVPQRGMDIGKLLPVELVWLHTDDGMIVIETDTGDLGRGENVAEAFRNLEDTTAGVIYMDTADYLLVSDQAEQWLGEMEPYLKAKTWICSCNEKLDLAEAAEYLAVHKPRDVLRTREISQSLSTENGRIILKGKKD